MYTSYVARGFDYAKSIKDRRFGYGGAKSRLVGVGRAGGRVTPDSPETSLNRGFSPMVYSHGIPTGIQEGVSYEYSKGTI